MANKSVRLTVLITEEMEKDLKAEAELRNTEVSPIVRDAIRNRTQGSKNELN